MDARPVSMGISPVKILPLRFAFLRLHRSFSDWALSHKWENCMFSQVVVVIIIIISVCVHVGNLLGLHLKPFMFASYCSFIHVFRF